MKEILHNMVPSDHLPANSRGSYGRTARLAKLLI